MYGENCAQRRYKMMRRCKMMQTSLHRRLDRPDKVTKLSTLSADAVKTCGDNETMKRMRLRARLRIMIAERCNLNKGAPLPSMSSNQYVIENVEHRCNRRGGDEINEADTITR
ncbi:hypothetical protein BU17DRAFT_64980 [Hysterangium stoloniferum]|nr:hypothetical protein BU17DRAFT_64980 [Hysterangium stoloniferum]